MCPIYVISILTVAVLPLVLLPSPSSLVVESAPIGQDENVGQTRSNAKKGGIISCMVQTNRNPTNWLGQAKRRATANKRIFYINYLFKIRPKAAGDGIFGRIFRISINANWKQLVTYPMEMYNRLAWMSVQILVILGCTVAELFDSLTGHTSFTHFCATFNWMLQPPVAASEVISDRFMRPIVSDKCVKFRDPCLKLSQEIPPEANGRGIFYCFSSDNFRSEIDRWCNE